MEREASSAGHGVGRLTRLDGLRGIAACGVAFLYHPQMLFTPDVHGTEPGLFHWFHDWGWTLVDLFFLISGYIFAHVYLGRSDAGLSRSNLGDFAVARIARLYPLHILTLCLCAVLFLADPANTWLAFIAHLLMLQAFVQPNAHAFNEPSWSISVEMACYVLFALGAAASGRALRWITAIAIVGALLQILLMGRPEGPWVGDGLPRGLLGFFFGQFMWRIRHRLALTSTALLVCLFVFGLALDMGPMSSLPPLCLYAWPAALLLALRSPFMGSRPMQWLGDRSYAIYLIHYPVLLLARNALRPISGDFATELVVTLAFAVPVLILSDLCYRIVECPSRRAIRMAWARHRGHRGEQGTSLA